MKVRAIAALALVGFILRVSPIWAGCGWYLLTPPVHSEISEEVKKLPHDIAPAYMGDWDAPLNRWEHEGSFDTAAACEKTLVLLMERAKAEEPKKRLEHPNGYPTLRSTLLAQSRCIASDDPRLNGKGTP